MYKKQFLSTLVAITILFTNPAVSSVDSAGSGNYADLVMGGEGGGNWSATNPGSTATGGYQFTYGTLVDLGFIKPGQKTPGPGAGSWSGIEWTGKGGVYSRSDFMANRGAQDLALNDFTQRNWNLISSNTPVGTTVNGVTMTQGGALYAAHMLGPGGYNQWASCNFQASCLDAKIASAHGWTQEEYKNHLMKRIAEGGGYDTSLIASSGGGAGGMGGTTPSIETFDTKLMCWNDKCGA